MTTLIPLVLFGSVQAGRRSRREHSAERRLQHFTHHGRR